MRSTSRQPMFWVIPVLLGAVFTQIGAAADTPLGWSWDQVTIRPTLQGESECVVQGATFYYALPGEPDLPAVLVQIPAPERSSPESFEIFGAVTSERDCETPIAPAPEDHPTETGGPVHVAPLASAYQAASYPADRVRFLGISTKRGVAWASFAVYPLTLERGHKLILLEEGTLTVRWKSDPTIPAPLKSLRPESYLMRDLTVPGSVSEQGSAQLSTDRPSLTGNAVRFVVIAPASFADSLQKFVAWKNQTGTTAVLRTIEWIYQNYPDGVDHQEQIRNFLRDAYVYWGTEYLMIVGGVDQVPIRTAKYLTWNYPATMDIITDYYYACLEGTWNADGDAFFGEGYHPPSGNRGDNADFSPELVVGRIPVTGTNELHNWLAKYWKYVKNPDRSGYLDRTLMMGEVLFNVNWSRDLLPTCGLAPCPSPQCGTPAVCVEDDGAGDCVDVIGIIDGSGVHLAHKELYEWFEHWQANGRPNAELELKSACYAALTDGAGWIQHVGHGSFDRISVGTDDGSSSQARILSTDVVGNVLNRDKPGILYSINCSSAEISAKSIASTFLSGENGEITYVGSTNLDFPSTARSYELGFWTKAFMNKKAPGVAFSETQDENARSIGNTEDYRRFLTYSLIFLGDPQVNGWIGTPSLLTLNAPAQMSLSDTTYSVTVTQGSNPVQGAVVCAYKAGDVYGVATTGANGVAVVPFRPTSTGAFTVWVTENSSVPKQLSPSPTVVAPGGTGSSVLATSLTVVDGSKSGQPRAGTTGNGNARFEAGETVDLDLTVKNVGNAVASNVLFTLSADSMASRLNIITGSFTAPSIAAGATTTLTGAFRVQVPAVPPDTSNVKPDTLLNRDRLAYDTNVTVHDGSRSRTFPLALYAYRPDFRLMSVTMHNVADTGDTIPSNGETWQWNPLVRNVGTGTMANMLGTITAVSGSSVVVDTSSFAGAAEDGNNVSLAHPVQFLVNDETDLRLSFAISSKIQENDVFFRRPIGFGRPLPPAFYADSSGTPTKLQTSKDAIVVIWQKSPSPNVQGYVLKRATDPGGPYLPVIGDLLTRMEYYKDQGLAGLTRYYYKIAAVDVSGNESLDSRVVSATTSPATLAGWPVILDDVGYGCPTVEPIPNGPYRSNSHIFMNTDAMYAWNADGSEFIDGDNLSTTTGVFSSYGANFWGKPAIGDLNGDGIDEIVATARKDFVGGTGGARVLVWAANGDLLWQKTAGSADLISSPVIANIKGEGGTQQVLVQNDGAIYAWNADGSPVISGSNGILKQVAVNMPYTYGSLAVADLDGDGREEIVYAYGPNFGASSSLSVVKFDGTNANVLNTVQIDNRGPCNSSPAILHASDGTWQIFVDGPNHLSGWRWLTGSNSLQQMWSISNGTLPTSKNYDPSVALGNVSGNAGEIDVVAAGRDGKIYAVESQTGHNLIGFPFQLGSPGSKLGSPILVDMDNDATQAEIVVGDDGGTVYAIKGKTGHGGEELPGFPYAAGGAILQGLAYWDVDKARDASQHQHPELLIQAASLPTVTTLELTNVNFPDSAAARATANPWPSFRHDERNSGCYNTDQITPVSTMEATGSAEGGAAVIHWSAPVRPETFRVQRSGLDGAWDLRQEGPPSEFQKQGQQQGQGFEYRDPSNPGTYTYRILGLDGSGSIVLQSEEIQVTVLPIRLRLVGAVPNPFNPRTMIRYESPQGKVQLEIIDLSGRVVRSLFDGTVQPGMHDVEWDGRNNQGHDVGSGIYLARLRGTGGLRSQKIVLLR